MTEIKKQEEYITKENAVELIYKLIDNGLYVKASDLLHALKNGCKDAVIVYDIANGGYKMNIEL